MHFAKCKKIPEKLFSVDFDFWETFFIELTSRNTFYGKVQFDQVPFKYCLCNTVIKDSFGSWDFQWSKVSPVYFDWVTPFKDRCNINQLFYAFWLWWGYQHDKQAIFTRKTAFLYRKKHFIPTELSKTKALF